MLPAGSLGPEQLGTYKARRRVMSIAVALVAKAFGEGKELGVVG